MSFVPSGNQVLFFNNSEIDDKLHGNMRFAALLSPISVSKGVSLERLDNWFYQRGYILHAYPRMQLNFLNAMCSVVVTLNTHN